jgi:hypothetical protein
MTDYLKAYSTTGKPPQPCSSLPLHPADRARVGLPPLFQPYVELGGQPSTEDPLAVTLQIYTTAIAGTPTKDMNALPDVQMFTPTADASEPGQLTTYLQSITAQQAFSAFSFEVAILDTLN